MMTPQELARRAAVEIVEAIQRPALGPPMPVADVVQRYVEGAISRALAESSDVRHLHSYSPQLGRVDVKVTKSTTGVALEVDVGRPREAGETFEQAADAAADLAAAAYERALRGIERLGLTPGKEPKA